jgi:hypothetical protein
MPQGKRAAIFTAVGIVATVAISVHLSTLSTAPEEYMLEDYPTRPPVMDHTAFGVGNEDAIEGVASKLFKSMLINVTGFASLKKMFLPGRLGPTSDWED